MPLEKVRRSNGPSLKWRLPLLIGALVSVVLGTFLWTTYREVAREQLQTAGARAQLVSSEIGGSLLQSTQQRLREARRLVSTPAMQGCLRAGTADACEQARQALAAFPATGPQVVELWTATGTRVLTIAKPPTADATMPDKDGPPREGIGALQAQGDVLYAETAVSVLAGNATASSGSPADPAGPLGFVVIRRPLQATPARDLLNRLAGSGGAIKIGNKAGDVWTDLASIVPAPTIDLHRPGVATYRGNDGRTFVGALADIRGTPWVLWVEFPESVVLAPARAFLSRMLLIAVLFLAVATVLARVLTARITTPLSDLTDISEAIAAGEYSRRVATDRRDEIGRLGTAFNIMAERVDQTYRDLGTRVSQRTASLAAATEQLEQRLADLNDERQKLESFFFLSVDMLCIADLDGHFLRVNPAWEKALGWTAEDLTGVPYLDFVHPEDREATAAASATLASGTSVFSLQNRFRCKDGSYRWLSWRAAAHQAQGRIYAAARDVTELRRTAREAERQVTELAAVNHELEAFSYSVSHDLRAPLRHISGFAGILNRSAGPRLEEHERRSLATITDAAARMGQLIDDLLSFSRTSRTPIARRRMSLGALVDDVRHEVAAAAADRDIVWTVGALPDIEADYSMLRMVLVNLLSNALKYTGTRTQTCIEIGTTRDPSGDVIVFVRDNGVGFDMQYAHKLFGVFQRLHRSEDFDGTGIGLANVRRIIQRHGGRVWADAEVDRGATFYFSIPEGVAA